MPLLPLEYLEGVVSAKVPSFEPAMGHFAYQALPSRAEGAILAFAWQD